MLSFDALRMRYEPFPIGVAQPTVPDDLYVSMLDRYPPHELFIQLPKVGHKYTLSPKFNRKAYEGWIRSEPVWREFHGWVRSNAFLETVLDALRERHVDLGLSPPKPAAMRLLKRLRQLVRGRSRHTPKLSARFEFSMLPAAGGYVIPHTDAPGKIITLVVSMVREGEWNPAWGGGTDVNRPRYERLMFNKLNARADFEDMEVLHTYEFRPNQAVVFVKTFNSWHSVRPMRGNDEQAMRRTLTINVEADR